MQHLPRLEHHHRARLVVTTSVETRVETSAQLRFEQLGTIAVCSRRHDFGVQQKVRPKKARPQKGSRGWGENTHVRQNVHHLPCGATVFIRAVGPKVAAQRAAVGLGPPVVEVEDGSELPAVGRRGAVVVSVRAIKAAAVAAASGKQQQQQVTPPSRTGRVAS